MSDSPALATLEKLISDRAYEKAQAITQGMFVKFESELAQLTGQTTNAIFVSYDGKENASVRGLLSIVSARIVEVTTDRLALQVAQDIIRKNQEILKGLEEVLG